MADPGRPTPAVGAGRGAGSAALLALLALLALMAVTAAASPVRAQELPDGVSEAAVERGRRLYLGDGFCYTCHGRDGRGVRDMGAGLVGRDWTYSDGSMEGLARVIRDGITAETSTTGIPMPPRGGARLTSEQIRAVAAYVWTLSRGGPGGAP